MNYLSICNLRVGVQDLVIYSTSTFIRRRSYSHREVTRRGGRRRSVEENKGKIEVKGKVLKRGEGAPIPQEIGRRWRMLAFSGFWDLVVACHEAGMTARVVSCFDFACW